MRDAYERPWKRYLQFFDFTHLKNASLKTQYYFQKIAFKPSLYYEKLVCKITMGYHVSSMLRLLIFSFSSLHTSKFSKIKKKANKTMFKNKIKSKKNKESPYSSFLLYSMYQSY